MIIYKDAQGNEYTTIPKVCCNIVNFDKLTDEQRQQYSFVTVEMSDTEPTISIYDELLEQFNEIVAGIDLDDETVKTEFQKIWDGAKLIEKKLYDLGRTYYNALVGTLQTPEFNDFVILLLKKIKDL